MGLSWCQAAHANAGWHEVQELGTARNFCAILGPSDIDGLLPVCRIHVCIESLLEDEQLISLLQDLLLLSDRAKLQDLPALAAG